MNIYSQISANKWKSVMIMIGFTLFVGFIAYVFGEASGYGMSFTGIALVISGIISFSSYWWSDKVVLSLSGARPADKNSEFDFYTVAENISIAAGIPMPKLYVIDDPAMNAFATGRDPKHAAVAATSGLLKVLSRSELEGVVAHELSHVSNYDTRLLAIVTVLVGFIAILSDMFSRQMFWGGGRRDRENNSGGIFILIAILLSIAAPIIGTLIKLAISRKREYLADASGALLTRNPDALADALVKISSDPRLVKNANSATAPLYIDNPFRKRSASQMLSNLFNTHPPVEDRIRILRAM